MNSPTTVRLTRRSAVRRVPPGEFSAVQVQLPAWQRVTPETVRLRVVAPEMPVLSETALPLLSIHKMVGGGLPLTPLAHTRVMIPPSRTAVSTSGPTNSGGSVMKKDNRVNNHQSNKFVRYISLALALTV